ncbi:hypothetical protein IMZ48_02480 [Candidatus Bathyarchaeota archaeon]|nr:hypothetical protein [Candidatus Bathyarchaeota archaeon]
MEMGKGVVEDRERVKEGEREGGVGWTGNLHGWVFGLEFFALLHITLVTYSPPKTRVGTGNGNRTPTARESEAGDSHGYKRIFFLMGGMIMIFLSPFLFSRFRHLGALLEGVVVLVVVLFDRVSSENPDGGTSTWGFGGKELAPRWWCLL